MFTRRITDIDQIKTMNPIDWDIVALGILPNPKYPLANQLEVTLISQLVYGESRNQDYEGMKAVASVAVNRWKKMPMGSIRDIILAHAQFSCFNRRDPNYHKIMNIAIEDIPVWKKCAEAGLKVYMGLEKDNTNGATLYLTHECYDHNRPKWNWDLLVKTIQIGDHLFFKEK